jgi:hypothetical protein
VLVGFPVIGLAAGVIDPGFAEGAIDPGLAAEVIAPPRAELEEDGSNARALDPDDPGSALVDVGFADGF